MRSRLISFVVSLLLISPVADAQAKPALPPSKAKFDKDLETMASFIQASGPFSNIGALCAGTVKEGKSKRADVAALEQAIPGIVDHMADAMGAHCAREWPRKQERRLAKIKADLRQAVTPVLLARYLTDFGGALSSIQNVRINPAAGPTLVDAAKNSFAPKLQRLETSRDLRAKERQFLALPGAQNFTAFILSYQKTNNAAMMEDVREMLVPGMAVARQAGNAYAREKGHEPPLPEN